MQHPRRWPAASPARWCWSAAATRRWRWTRRGCYPGAARLDQLAAQVKTALGGTTPTKVLVDTSLFTGPETGLGWDSDDISPDGQVSRIQALMTDGGRVEPVHHEHGGDPRSADPALAAGRAFAKLLGVPPARSTAARRRPALAPAGDRPPPTGVSRAGTELGEVQSPPLVRLVDLMLSRATTSSPRRWPGRSRWPAASRRRFDGTAEAMMDKLRRAGPAGRRGATWPTAAACPATTGSARPC